MTSASLPVIRLVTCGSVDDGKSTLIGRLLADTNNIPLDTLAAAKSVRRSGSTVPVGEIDYSLLTDGLEAEREQGITIDVAYRSMNLSSGARLIIADAPGHEQYTANMAVAASRADVALVLLDATRGVRPQTLRHLNICALMGVAKVGVVINKLDAVAGAGTRFAELSAELTSTTEKLGFSSVEFIPVSALHGLNIIEAAPQFGWYTGPTLLGFIESPIPVAATTEGAARMAVQYIARADNFRGVSGTVAGGKFAVGDEIIVLPSNRTARVASIETFEGQLPVAEVGQPVTMVLEPDVDATRGDMIAAAASHATPASRFAANLIWVDGEDLVHSRSYLLIAGSAQVPAMVTNVKYAIDINTGAHEAARKLSLNQIGNVELSLNSPLALDSYSANRLTGNFVLVDRVTMRTVAAGMITHALRRSENVVEHHFEVDRDVRAAQKHQTPKVIWFTGLSGSGKSTIANELDKRLVAKGYHTYVLDGDNLRLGLNKDLGFTAEDRAENVRRVGEVAKLMVDAGLVVLVSLVSPFRQDRDAVKEQFADGEFLEVWVDTPIEVCAERDPKGLYKKAATGNLPNMTGVGQGYEPPVAPFLRVLGTDATAAVVDQIASSVFED